MSVFLDACIDPRVAEAFRGHDVKTAVELDWHRLKDKELIPIVQDRFDVLVTIDQGFEHQQNLKSLRFGIVIAHVAKNRVAFYRPLFAQLQTAIAQVNPGEVIHVYSRLAEEG